MNSGAEQLKTKLALWRFWMERKDRHSITYQIYQMLWEDVTFRVINECRRLAPVGPEGRSSVRCITNAERITARQVRQGLPGPSEVTGALSILINLPMFVVMLLPIALLNSPSPSAMRSAIDQR